MPPKSKRTKKADPVEEVMQEVEATVPASTVCGYRNMHTENQEPCILEKGHAGNHSDGKYEWSDAAGTPTQKHA